jgi:hypothetical protein
MVLRTVWVPVWVMAGLAFDGAVLAGGAKTLLWEFVID